MTLHLTPAQRVSLLSLLDATLYSARDVRLVWQLQDKLMLSETDAEAVGLRIRHHEGARLFECDLSRPLPPEAMELDDVEGRIIRDAIEAKKYVPYFRPWLEPLLDQLEIR